LGNVCNEPCSHRIPDRGHYNWNCRRRLLGRARSLRAVRHYDIHRQPGKFERSLPQTIDIAVCRSVLESKVLTHDVTELVEPLMEVIPVGTVVDDANARDRADRCGARSKRPRGRAAEQAYQLAPSYVGHGLHLGTR